jgi:hypothetical protein
MKRFEEELLKEDRTHVRPEVEVKKVAIPEGEETYILCGTAGCKEKEKAIRNRFSNSRETVLKGLEKAIVMGRLKDGNKMERRLGKIQARHPQGNDLYDLDLRDTALGVRLIRQMKEDRKHWRSSAAPQSQGGNGGRAVVEVHAADGSGSVVPGAEERTFGSALVSSTGNTRKSARDGRVPRLCVVGHAEASAETPARDYSGAVADSCR